MKLLNIHNKGRLIYKFLRDDQGNLHIETDDSFFPYFYEPDPFNGTFRGYDGTPLKQVWCTDPSEIPERRSKNSWESEIRFTKRYVIDKINQFEECPVRWNKIDIEVKAPEIPDWNNPIYPVSCVTLYDNFEKKYWTYYIEECKGNTLEEKELNLFDNVVDLLKKLQPDLWISYNVSFDYNYMYARYKKITLKDFGREISPIKQSRYGERDFKTKNKVYYPAGISIIDYLRWYKKIFPKEKGYKLVDLMKSVLKRTKIHEEVDFNILSPIIKERNIDDVKAMVEIEDIVQLIPLYNNIRLISKVFWEDLYYNSRMIDMTLFEEGKRKKVVLPNAKAGRKEKKYGATRDLSKGYFEGLGKYDLVGAYIAMITTYCLDPANLFEEEKENSIKFDVTDPEGNFLGTYWFVQNEDALLPSAMKRLVKLKAAAKKEKSLFKEGTPERKRADKKYDGIKSIVLSGWGVFGNRFFRFYDKRMSNTITYLVRDLLIYVKDKIKEEGYDTKYWDTDSLFVLTVKIITDLLNEHIEFWGAEKYGKNEVGLEFEYEGVFQQVLLSTKCRYYGSLKTPIGEIKEEIKGLEIKRRDSSEFMAKFQKTLIKEKIFKKIGYEEIVKWIKEEMKRMQTLLPEQIAFPCKIGDSPLWTRAYNNAQRVSNFKKYKGDVFYYTYVKPKGKDTKGKSIDIIAFDKNDKSPLESYEIDWNKMIERNITNKAEVIFEAMEWKMGDLVLNGQQNSLMDYL